MYENETLLPFSNNQIFWFCTNITFFESRKTPELLAIYFLVCDSLCPKKAHRRRRLAVVWILYFLVESFQYVQRISIPINVRSNLCDSNVYQPQNPSVKPFSETNVIHCFGHSTLKWTSLNNYCICFKYKFNLWATKHI